MVQGNANASSRSGLPSPVRTLLLAAGNDLGVLGPILIAVDLEPMIVGTVEELIDVARSRSPDVVVLDPELGGTWPVDTAEAVVQGLSGQVPVVVVCRSREDAEQIEHRLGPHAATVLAIRAEQDVHELIAGLRGLIATQRRRAAALP